MRKYYSDEDIRDILGAGTAESEIIDNRIKEAFELIRSGSVSPETASSKKSKVKRFAYGLTTAAAVFTAAFILCAANPVMAANIPVIGSIFERVQSLIPFGRIPEDETVFLTPETVEADISKVSDVSEVSDASEVENVNSVFTASDNGLTLTLTEYYASNQAIFIGAKLESEEAFPKIVKDMGNDVQFIQLMTSEEYSFRSGDPVGEDRKLQGELADEHTFVGVIRIDYDSIRVDGRKYDEALKAAEEAGTALPEINSDTRDLYFDEYEIPDTFELKLGVEYFRIYSYDQGKETVRGEWSFSDIEVTQSTKDVRTIKVNEVNEEGIGLDAIEVSPVEITLYPVEPEEHLCFAVAVDRDGKKLGSSQNAYQLAIGEHDISEITVYVCDYDEYMNDIKGYAYGDEGMDFRDVLEERALYKKTVEIY